MSHRRADGARKRAGGLILLSVAWVGVLGVVPQSSPGKSSPSDQTATTDPYEISIDVAYVDSGPIICNIGTEAPAVLNDLTAALGETDNTTKIITSSLWNAPTVWDYDLLDDKYNTYKAYWDYRYWLVAVRHVTGVPGDLGGTLAVTPPGFGVLPGHDSRPNRPMSVILYDRLAAYVAEDNDLRKWSKVVIHEMGHQRACLQEYSTTYHLPETDPAGYRCVMHQFTQVANDPAQFEAVLEGLCFCGHWKGDYVYTPRTESCIRYLYQRSEEGP
jgi:hypothetical protein